jgi:hypothetical protein
VKEHIHARKRRLDLVDESGPKRFDTGNSALPRPWATEDQEPGASARLRRETIREGA